MGEDVDKGTRGVARVEPDSTQQVTACRANVPMGVVRRRDARQRKVIGEGARELDVSYQFRLLVDPAIDFARA